MFKASIALVLLAFAALAYGWIANNDAILYGSIGASALAGLALLGSHMADRKSPALAEMEPERPAKPARERRDTSAEAPSRTPERTRSRRMSSEEITRQLDLVDEDEDEEGLPPLPTPSVRPITPPPARKRQLKIPEGASWATEDDFGDEEEDYERAQVDYDAGFQEEDYPSGDRPEAGPSYRQGAAAADDFRSRLAAVLGQAGPAEQDEPEPEPPAIRPARTRRTAAPKAAAEPEPEPEPAEPAETPKPAARRGRKKAEPKLAAAEPVEEAPAAQESEPEWIRLEDVPRIARATQPGGGFGPPEVPQGVTPYRPRRPGVPREVGEPAAPATRRRTTGAGKSPGPATGKTAGGKATPAKPRAPKATPAAKSPVTKVSAAEPGDEPPKPRRGRPPKPKP